MAKARVDVSSVPDRVYAILREQILAGDLEPGARLHQEGISAELGVSRTPVREAIARLAAEGLVDLLANRGARVAAVGENDMEAAYEARLGIEPLAARLAAARRDAAELAKLRKTLTPARKGPKAAYAASRAFHLELAVASGNPFLVDFSEALWAGRLGLHVYAQQMTPEQFAKDALEHEQILDAIEAGDGDTAERLTREHITHAQDVLTGRVDSEGRALSDAA
jgi:DNA-binding GntR family transcriptional regulator